MIRHSFVRQWTAGDPIRGDVRIPEGPQPRTAIVVVHGFKGFKDWGFFPHVCERLAGAGHAVVSFNLSHNGVGADLENFIELDRFGANTLTRELDEVLFIVDEIAKGDLLQRPPERIGILGHSRGGGQAILAASEDERIDVVATWAAISHFDRWSDETKEEWRAQGRIWVLNSRTGQQMPLDVGLLENYEANRERLDIASSASSLERPWLIAHGTDDLTVPVQEARSLARVAPGARLLLVEGAGHTFEARHPFTASTPELDRVSDATQAHFARHLQA